MLKIMLVDDEQWCLKELREILLSTGQARVIGAHSSAQEALDEAVREAPDMAFIDVLMPGMTGLDLAKKLKVRLPDLSVVLVSEKEDYALDAFEIGADDYILKPVRRERVIKSLQRPSKAE